MTDRPVADPLQEKMRTAHADIQGMARPVADQEPLSAEDAKNLREVVESQAHLGHPMTIVPNDVLLRLLATLDAARAHPDEAGLGPALHVDCQPTEPCRLPRGYEDRVLAALDATRVHPDEAGLREVDAAIAKIIRDEIADPAERDRLLASLAALSQPAVPVAGAEPELQALAHEIAKEWTPHEHDPVKCPECAALRAAQPEDDGLDRHEGPTPRDCPECERLHEGVERRDGA